ncbi:MAG: 2-phospho-L-lactate transferase CofD family protein, partial [Candidatus Omnitrophota bacterium]
MYRLKTHWLVKTVSVLVIISFITLDIAWSHPSEFSKNTNALAAESVFQQEMMSRLRGSFQGSIISNIRLMSMVIDVAEYVLGDPKGGKKPLPEQHLYCVNQAETIMAGNRMPALREVGITRVAYNEKENVALLRYEDGKKSYVIQVALKDQTAERKLVGYDFLINDRFVIKCAEEERAVPEPGIAERRHETPDQAEGMKEKGQSPRPARRVVVVGGGAGTNFFSEVVDGLGWQIDRVLTPFDDGDRTGLIRAYMSTKLKEKNHSIDFFAVGDLTKALVDQASHSIAIQKIMETKLKDSPTLVEQVKSAIKAVEEEAKKPEHQAENYGVDIPEFETFKINLLELAEGFDRDFMDFGLYAHEIKKPHSLRHLIYLECFWQAFPEGQQYETSVRDGTSRFVRLLGITESNAFLSSVSKTLGKLVAERKDQGPVVGQSNITIDEKLGLVQKLTFDTGMQEFPDANTRVIELIDSLKPGDMIILGPGSFYTSVVCNLLPEGMVRAIAKAKRRGALPVFAFNPIYCNETKGIQEAGLPPFVEMTRQVEKQTGYRFDDLFAYCIVNDAAVNSRNVINLMSRKGSIGGDKKFDDPHKYRHGVIEGKDDLIRYFAAHGYDTTVISGNLMTVVTAGEKQEASYNPEVFKSILAAMAEDYEGSAIPEIMLVSDTHATIDGLIRFKATMPGRKIFNNGDMVDRGDELWNLMRLVDYFTLGDHELWAIGACLGHDYLLALWLRSLYRYPATTRILGEMGLDELIDSDRTRLFEQLKQIAEEQYSDTDLERLKELIEAKYGGAKKKFKGSDSVAEHLMFVIWLKVAHSKVKALVDRWGERRVPSCFLDMQRDIEDLPREAKVDRFDLRLTEKEERVLRDFRKAFLKKRPDKEQKPGARGKTDDSKSPANLAAHFLKGRVYQILQPLPDITANDILRDNGVSFYKPVAHFEADQSKAEKPEAAYPKALLLHANIPMDNLGNPVNLLGEAVPMEDLRAYFDHLNRNLAAIEERFRMYRDRMMIDGEINEDFWDFDLEEGQNLKVRNPEEFLMLLADSEYSPLFARKQTRIRTNVDVSSEPDNRSYVFLTRNYAQKEEMEKAKLATGADISKVKQNLTRLYGLAESDFTEFNGALYLANDGVNAKIAGKIAEAFGVDTIILGHIGRNKKTGEPAGFANGRIWMIDGSFAKKSGETGELAAEETGGFLLLRKRQSANDPGMTSGRLATLEEVLKNEKNIFNAEKAAIIPELTAKELLYFNAKLKWREVSLAPLLLQDLLKMTGDPKAVCTRKDWAVLYGGLSLKDKEKLIENIREALKGDKIREALRKVGYDVNSAKTGVDGALLKALAEIPENDDPRILSWLSVKPKRFILPVWMALPGSTDCVIAMRPRVAELTPETITATVNSSLSEVFARPAEPDHTIYI